MTPIYHPARTIPFKELLTGLHAAHNKGLVKFQTDTTTGLQLWCYTKHCVYERGWDNFSLIARGLIVDPNNSRVIATPFPKFFNIGEQGGSIPNIPFDTFEKVDGSLIIFFHYNGEWRAVTKGSFDSTQAVWARARLTNTTPFHPGTTYLAEAIYPENHIVIHYPEPALVLLAGYQEDGTELCISEIESVAVTMGWRIPKRYSYRVFSDLLSDAQSLPRTAEGFVIRFANGLRLKVKGEEYRRIHAFISRCTPLGVWEVMSAGDDLDHIRRDIPEEFWGDFDSILGILRFRFSVLTDRVAAAVAEASGKSDKELGLSLANYPADIRPLLFPWRKSEGVLDGRARNSIFRAIRPTGNSLEGYTPSYAVNQVLEEGI